MCFLGDVFLMVFSGCLNSIFSAEGAETEPRLCPTLKQLNLSVSPTAAPLWLSSISNHIQKQSSSPEVLYYIIQYQSVSSLEWHIHSGWPRISNDYWNSLLFGRVHTVFFFPSHPARPSRTDHWLLINDLDLAANQGGSSILNLKPTHKIVRVMLARERQQHRTVTFSTSRGNISQFNMQESRVFRTKIVNSSISWVIELAQSEPSPNRLATLCLCASQAWARIR